MRFPADNGIRFVGSGDVYRFSNVSGCTNGVTFGLTKACCKMIWNMLMGMSERDLLKAVFVCSCCHTRSSVFRSFFAAGDQPLVPIRPQRRQDGP